VLPLGFAMQAPGYLSRTPQRNSIGSVAFVITVLAVLGLGGGFLLAFLPFNSVERSATAPRNLPELRSFPAQHSSSPPEQLRDAEISKGSTFGTAVASLTVSAGNAFDFDPSETRSSFPSVSAESSIENSVRNNAVVVGPNFSTAPERFSMQARPVVATATSFDALQTVSVPEPATWILLIFGMLLGALVVRKSQRLAS
jgi:hypothetical protein